MTTPLDPFSLNTAHLFRALPDLELHPEAQEFVRDAQETLRQANDAALHALYEAKGVNCGGHDLTLRFTKSVSTSTDDFETFESKAAENSEDSGANHKTADTTVHEIDEENSRRIDSSSAGIPGGIIIQGDTGFDISNTDSVAPK